MIEAIDDNLFDLTKVHCSCGGKIMFDDTLKLYCCMKCNKTWEGIKIINRNPEQW